MIVLSMITKNSLKKVGVRNFERVWLASLQVPYESIILVDDSSNNDTVDFVRKFSNDFGKELIVSKSRLQYNGKTTRATARQTAIDIFFENFNDEWLFFLDDDFIIRNGWWNEASNYLNETKVGLIWGVDYYPLWVKRQRWIEARGVDELTCAIKTFTVRGGLHDALLRREAIAGLKLPLWLNVYEDAWIKKYIECKGFEWRIVKTGGDHLRASGEGYTQDDLQQALEISILLALEPTPFPRVLKTIFGLPAYIYYAKKAYGLKNSIKEGFSIWKRRVTYRYELWKKSNNNIDPCEIINSHDAVEKFRISTFDKG